MPESITDRITRVTAELTKLREARDAQLTGGAEKQTGVFRLKEVDYAQLVKDIARKEAELARLEDLAAGRSPVILPQFRTRGH